MLSRSPRETAIDLVVLSRDDSPLHPDVQRGIDSQTGVHLIVHRVVGERRNDERNRLPAIVRARNQGKHCGRCSWLMFLDDDVVLARDAVLRLLDGLSARPRFAAMGADYLHESRGRVLHGHVAMGATLFRRQALDRIEFRWSSGKCECLCCCLDLRRKGMQIGYLPEAAAQHISLGSSAEHTPAKTSFDGDSATAAAAADGDGGEGRAYIYTAFDRKHLQKFQHRFMTSLRAAGNQEPVYAFAYGLYPSERLQLRRLRGVEVISLPSSPIAVPIRRLLDFQGPLKSLPKGSIVAYWDAGDVIFQDRLTELWRLAKANPERLLVVAEPFGYPENGVVARWTLSISDPAARKYAFDLLSTRPYFNGGFAAGTSSAMLRYLQAAHELLHSKALRGTKDWGDQTAMNLYCHSDPERFLSVDDRWNYCICQRPERDRQLLADGRFVRSDGRRLSVIHGNGAAFIPYATHNPVALARSSGTARFLI